MNLIALSAVIIINYFATTGNINGVTPGNISDANSSMLTPAGFTFSVWSVIYLLLIITQVIQLFKILKQNQLYFSIINRTGIFFILSCLLNIGWIFSWHYGEMLLSAFVMLLLFINLYIIYAILYSEKKLNREAGKMLVPFSIYTAWITVAIVSNFAAIAVHTDMLNELHHQFYIAIIFCILIFIYANYMLLVRKDWIFALTIGWALFGLSASQKLYVEYNSAGYLSLILSLIILLVIAVRYIYKYTSGYSRSLR